jgi:phosphoglycolate phosphatase-like HAD superfamily hydrolase
MRVPVVLFDLDGTVIDSGAIILASMRHATLTVLAREVDDETLMAGVGGLGLAEQMRVIDELRAEELVRVYREHNEPLHATLEPCAGMLDVLRELAEERRLGLVTAKRRVTVDLAFAVLPELEPLFEVVVARCARGLGRGAARCRLTPRSAPASSGARSTTTSIAITSSTIRRSPTPSTTGSSTSCSS